MVLKKTLCVVMLLLVSLIGPACVFAAFELSIRAYDGGSDLRFGRVNNFGPPPNREVIVSVNSDVGKQYQLVQTLLEPLTNDQGGTLPSENFTVYAMRGSNRQGTISVADEMPVTFSRTTIYTSSQQGLSDSFSLVYVVKNGVGLSAGSYRGRLAFILEPIGSAEVPVTVVVNIFADMEAPEPGVEIKTKTGSKVISLNSLRDEGRSSDCFFEIKGDRGSPFRIMQQLQEAPVSQDGEILPLDAITFQISDVKKGSGPAQPTPVSTRLDTIYTSSPAGEADAFVVTYRLAEKEDQRAGIYRSPVNYFLESGVVREALGLFSCEVEIARKFDLNVTPEMGGIITFRDLKADEPPKQSEVVIEIKSNIGRQYQVGQQLVSALVNQEGRAIPEKNFTLKEEALDTKGTLPFLASPTQVKAGDMILFVSDKEGSSDRFKIVYELSPSIDIAAGDYSARLMYSISEI
jgi:hypothetical protein